MQTFGIEHVQISPKYRATKLINPTLTDKIDVFEDQMLGELFQHALHLVSAQYPSRLTAGIPALMIVGAYFETIAGFLNGESSARKSRLFFQQGFLTVFPNFLEILRTQEKVEMFSDLLYRELRCGLFHELGPRAKIVLSQDEPASLGVMSDEDGEVVSIVLCPARFVQQVVGHFQHYVETLRQEGKTEDRLKFERAWDNRMKGAWPVVPPPRESRDGSTFSALIPNTRK